MKKQSLILASSLALLGAALVSCGNGGGGGTKADIAAKEGKAVIDVKMVKLGYGVDWLKDMAKAYNEKTGVGFNFDVVVGSKGVTTIADMVESYEIKADLVLTKNTQFEKDIYFSQGSTIHGQQVDCMFADLSDVYNYTNAGENKSIKEKMYSSYEDYYNFGGKYYGVPWAGGIMGIVRNLNVWQNYGFTDADVPLTTNELLSLCQTVKEGKTKSGQTALTKDAFIYSAADEYYTAIANIFTAQYEGRDTMNNNFLKGKDPDGKYSANFYTYDGQEKTLELMKELIDNYQQKNPRSYDFTMMQQQFLLSKALFCVNGSWLESEMGSSDRYAEIDYIKFPVISAVAERTSFGTASDADAKLHTLVEYVDQHPTAGDVSGKPDFASDADVQIVREARQYAYVSSGADHQAFIPIQATDIEPTKDFLKFMYSDEGLESYYRSQKGGLLPAYPTRTLTGVDTTTKFRKSINNAMEEGHLYTESAKARIFALGKVSYYYANNCEGIVQCFLSEETSHRTVRYIMDTNNQDLHDRWETIVTSCNNKFE